MKAGNYRLTLRLRLSHSGGHPGQPAWHPGDNHEFFVEGMMEKVTPQNGSIFLFRDNVRKQSATFHVWKTRLFATPIYLSKDTGQT